MFLSVVLPIIFWIPRLIGPVAALEPVKVLATLPILLPCLETKASKSCVGAVKVYITASSIAERIPKRGKRVKIDQTSTNFLAKCPCVAPPTALIMFFLDLIFHAMLPISSYGNEPTALVDWYG